MRPLGMRGIANSPVLAADRHRKHALGNDPSIIYITPQKNLHGADMAINVNNPEADALTRQFAQMTGLGITDAIVIAMKEAIERRSRAEMPLETAARLRAKHQVELTEQAQTPLPRQAFDAMWDDT